MITNIQTTVTFSDGKTYPVDNFKNSFNSVIEFDHNEKHYCVRMIANANFETYIGKWDDDYNCWKYTRQFDLTVVKICRSETFIDDFACI